MVNKPVSARHHLASLALAVLATFSTSIHAQATISAGDTTYRGSFTTDAKSGAVNGSGTVQWKNGNRYEGPVVNTQLTGKGSFTWANGDTYVGDMLNAQPHGQGTYTFKSGDRYTGAWRNGQKHGMGTYTFANGTVWEGEFANDQQFKQGAVAVAQTALATPAPASEPAATPVASPAPAPVATPVPAAAAPATTTPPAPLAQASAAEAPWVGKRWEVRRATDDVWRTPTWVFNANGTAEATGLWKGIWSKLPNGRVQLKFITSDGKASAYEVEFSPTTTAMTLYRDGAAQAYGRTATAAETAETAAVAAATTGKMVGCYNDNGDGTLTDPVSGLVWAACPLGQRWDGSTCKGPAQSLKRGDAFFAAWRENLTGKGDWIVPTHKQWNNTFLASCKQWTDGNEYWISGGQKRFSYWTTGDMTEVVTPSGKGFKDKDSEAFAWVRLVRNVSLPDKEIFMKELNTSRKYSRFIEANPSWETVRNAPTQSALSAFLTKYPNAPQSTEARALLGAIVYPPVRQENTSAAYARFIRDWPDVPEVDLARERLWVLGNALFAPAKKAKNFDALVQFIQAAPDAPQAEEAKQLARELLEPSMKTAEDAGRCEDARSIHQRLANGGLAVYFDYKYCTTERNFKQAMAGKSPQPMFLTAVKLENEDQRGQAKKIYLTLIDRFPDSPVAMKAAERLTALKDVESVENAQSATRREIGNAQWQQKETAFNACKVEEDSCRNKVPFGKSISHCARDCNRLLQ